MNVDFSYDTGCFETGLHNFGKNRIFAVLGFVTVLGTEIPAVGGLISSTYFIHVS